MKDISILNVPAFKRKKVVIKKDNTKKRQKNEKALKELEFYADIPLNNKSFPEATSYEENLIKENKNIKTMTVSGRCDGYFEHNQTAKIEVTSPLRKGDQILIETDQGLFETKLNQIISETNSEITLARSGSKIIIHSPLKPKIGGSIYKICN